MRKSLEIRSWFNVRPSGDAAALRGAGADALVVDLAESEDLSSIAEACRRTWADNGQSAHKAFLLPPFSSGRTEALAGFAVALGVDFVLLAGARGGTDVQHLEAILRAEEARADRHDPVSIVALASSAGLLAGSSFERCSKRLHALGWENHFDPSSDAARLARATAALVASAAGVIAIDAASPVALEADFRSECLLARQNGFAGKLTYHPSQIPVIQSVFGGQPPDGRVISKTSAPPSA